MRSLMIAGRGAVLFAVLGVGLALAQTSLNAVLTNGLAAFWPFDGDGSDASGNGQNAFLSGIGSADGRFHTGALAAKFDGVVSYGVVSNRTLLNQLPITISLWTDAAPGFGGDRQIIGNYFVASAAGTGIFVNGPDVTSWFFGSNGSLYPLDQTGRINGHWHQITTTFDQSGGAIYIDGVQAQTISWTGSESTGNSAENIVFGKYENSGGGVESYFAGDLADVRVYARSLSSDEVATLYRYESTPSAAAGFAGETNGFVVAVSVTNPGNGYGTNIPPVRLLGGGGNGASATATVEHGVVTGIQITNPGSGYTNAPLVLIGGPPGILRVQLEVAAVDLTLTVVQGYDYQLQGSFDLHSWTNVGPVFLALTNTVLHTVKTADFGQFFRVLQVP